MTFDEAIADLRAKRAAMLTAVAETTDDIGREAVRRIQEVWPVDTGDSRDGWHWNTKKGRRNRHGGRIMNEVPYTEFVHHGLAFRLVPRVLNDLQPRFKAQLTSRLAAVGRS